MDRARLRPWGAIPLLALALSCTCGAATTIVGGQIGDTAPDIVYKGDQLRPFLLAASSRRVDIAGIGDSNQSFGSNGGRDYGDQLAWSNQFGMYASEVLPVNAVGQQPLLGLGVNPGTPYSYDQTDPRVPADAAAMTLDPALGFFSSAGYVPADTKSPTYAAIYVSGSSPFFSPRQGLIWHAAFYKMPGTTGAITPDLRGNGSAPYQYNDIKVFPPMTIPAGDAQSLTGPQRVGPSGTQTFVPPANQIYDLSLKIDRSTWTQGAGDWKIYLYNYEQSYFGGPNASVKGPLYEISQRLENPDRNKGISYSTLLYQGGKSARDAAVSLATASDTALSEWMRQATRLQNVGGDKSMLLVAINHGQNDQNNSQPSVGPHPAPTNTAAGFEDNLNAIVTRLREVWTESGFDPHNLFFTVGPYQAYGGYETKLPEFESGAMALADQTYNVTVVRGSKMLTGLTMDTDGYYNTSTDHAHMSRAGYENVGRLGVNQLVSTVGDVTGRSSISSLDFTLSTDTLTFSPTDLQLSNNTTGITISDADLAFSFDSTTKVLHYTFPGLPGDVLPVGAYTAAFPGGFSYQFGALSIPPDNSHVPEPCGLVWIGAAFLFARRARHPVMP
jgi:hypothetical protein